jgi:predicted nuclease with RNAse H fold
VSTHVKSKPLIAIGWDVRGWRGCDQAVAMLSFAAGSSTPKWLAVSGRFQFGPGEQFGLRSLLAPLPGERLPDPDQAGVTVVVGIDAPLAFPARFVSLMKSENQSGYCPPEREIDNVFAYRDCERWIFGQHARKPLSATFDRLGNNATLAMCMAQALGAEGFQRVPQDAGGSDRAVIEVYPGIAKRGKKKSDRAIAPVERHLPDSVVPGTDEYDAAICAILAAVFAGKGNALELPDLVAPRAGYNPAEGWIYGLPAEYVRAWS